MIADSISQAKRYFSVNPLFARAFDYVAAIDLATIAEGRYKIEGDDVFMIIADNQQLRRVEDAPLEVHDKYIDIQIVICGRESFGWRARESCDAPHAQMDAAKDILFYDDKPTTYITVEEGGFVVFFPSDAHAPLVGEGTVKKCIIKVLA